MRFCLSKLNWFSDAVPLYHLNGFFAEVYAAIDTDQFSGCFSRWVADSVNITKGEIIAIDGKCLRRSIDKALLSTVEGLRTNGFTLTKLQ